MGAPAIIIPLRRCHIVANRSERFAFYSHLGGAAAFVIGLLVLLALTWGRWDYLAVIAVYGVAASILFSFSAVYHALKRRDNETSIWRKLDHIAIFIMIAGSYTPLVYIYLDGVWRWSMIVIPWSLVALGVFFKLFWIRAPRVISPIMYLGMGWLALVPLRELWLSMPPPAFWGLVAGGVAYSIGAVIYALKRPNPFPGVFGFHDIFHLWIIIGALIHFGVVLGAVL
ncbi:PAQR family membrane homeostasis protein TrhA [Dehalogenimonas alkenigignens]|uniref:Putative membrane protein, hemolysin III-like protein n=1 Tax=Dehalogenimonas alkenigignens TaxID=1217799 RepID=A0A0W0GGA9_9CHLR|nr:hemolysin III family protein [Dehalogenimonas alkenigignens]KTB47605.1 putative membrane protein, hemolysin III-like protein [Dehalogenimonas alkenigignens]